MSAEKKTFLEEMNRPAFFIAPAPAADRPLRHHLRRRLPQKIRLIQFECAAYYSVELSLLTGPRRGIQPVAFARQIAMFFVMELTGATSGECAAAFSGREHATALYSRRMVESACLSYPSVKADVQRLREHLQALPEFLNCK